jgi:molybdate transport system permease protein
VDFVAIALSVRLALYVTITLLVLGVPLAYGLSQWRFRHKYLVEAVIALPLVLPPTVLGFYVLVAIGPNGALGRAYEAVTGRPLAFSFEGLFLASVLYSLPFAVQPFMAAFARIDRRLIETAYCLGASRFKTLVRVVLPLARTGILAGSVLAFAHTLGEFGVVLMVGGNLPGRTRTVSIAIYDDVQSLDYARAGRTAALLLCVSFVVLAFTYALERRRGAGSIGTWTNPPTRASS